MAVVVILAPVVTGLAALAAYSWWSLRREAVGLEIHAHADGTVHTHHRGSRPHVHPTFADRYDARLAAWFGPAPHPRSVDLAGPGVQRQQAPTHDA